MEKNRFFQIFKKKLVIFLIQIVILILSIYLFDYKYNLKLQEYPKPSTTSEEQIAIIEWLANYILYEDLNDLFFIYTIWFLISMIPIFIYNNYKKAYSMNLTTFFFPNFFFYVFLRNHYETYFNSNFLNLFIKTIILGIFIVSISIGISFALKTIIKTKVAVQYEDLQLIASKCISKCPKCGTEFNSIPQFCYNCNTKLTMNTEDNVENAKL